MAEWPKVLYRVRVETAVGEWQVDDTGDRRARSLFPVAESVEVVPASRLEEVERERDETEAARAYLQRSRDDRIERLGEAELSADRLQAILDALVGDGAVEAAGTAASAEHDFRPYDRITRTILQAAVAAAQKQAEGERGEGGG